MKTCKHCQSPLDPTKPENIFCNRSCAASFNNKAPGRKHGPAPTKPKNPPKQKLLPRTAEEQRLLSREQFQCSKAKNHYKVAIGDRAAIRAIYLSCPQGYEVDHIVPFFAGGAHHEDNLQYLTPSANKAKHKADIKKYGAIWSGQ